MTRQQCDRHFEVCLILLVACGCAGFGLWFAPGWANGWPVVPRNVVWPARLTSVTFVIGMCLVVGSGAAICSRLRGGHDRVARALRVWSMCGFAIVVLACLWIYHDLHSAALQMWP